MYRYTLHNLTHDSGDIQSPGPDWFLKTAIYAPPERLVCIWERNYSGEDEWGGVMTATHDIEVAGCA